MNNCNQIAKNILMEEHVWYKYRFIVAIIIGFFIGILFHSPNVFGSSCIVSMLSACVVYYGIEYYAQMIVDNNRVHNLIERCQSMSNVNVRAKVDASDSVLRNDTQNIIDKFSGIVLQKATNEKFCNNNTYKKVNREIMSQEKTINKCSDSMLDEYNAYSEGFRNPYSNINSNYELLKTQPIPSPPAQVGVGACMLGKNECSPVCSGADENPCNLQLSTPGPQWQVQSANAVQNRLNNGQFVPNFCPL